MDRSVRTAQAIHGVIEVPGDKSIAHRAAIIASIADGTSHIVNYPTSADPQSTLRCLEMLGVTFVEDDEDGILRVEGRGRGGLSRPEGRLDCGNSGTTLRLLAGVLAGHTFDATLEGDASLRTRPMQRIAEPLRAMGADISLDQGKPPVKIRGGALRGITYRLPVASAQVKSCVLLAGLHAEGETTVIERLPSRDHTERMLRLSTIELGDERHIVVRGNTPVPGGTWSIPGDFSAAAFFLVAGAICREGQLRLPGVGLNPSRSALLDVLTAMGARITVTNEREVRGETLADLTVWAGQPLTGVTVSPDLVPSLIDEIPVLAVAATQAEGTTTVRGAGELRHKESDRLDAIADNLRALGATVSTHADGFDIKGPTELRGSAVDSRSDHRIAMAFGIAGLIAKGTTTIGGSEAADISYPGFWEDLERVALR